ncbi:transglutaminase 5, like [Amia ocellicauda]|uniref:transglutaminase 5, like n=1 Tax=Amia ocellicauda TaxID=2972642 RepID=UPI00346406E0
MNMYTSGFILMTVSIDRCLGVASPVWYRNNRPTLLARKVCLSLCINPILHVLLRKDFKAKVWRLRGSLHRKLSLKPAVPQKQNDSAINLSLTHSRPHYRTEGLNLKYTNLEQRTNHRKHDTERLGSKFLVVRRGLPFKVTLLFEDRGYNPNKEKLIFTVFLGKSSVSFPATFSMHQSQSQWSALIQPGDIQSRSLSVHIVTPPDACIGLHTLHVQILSPYQSHTYNIAEFILLFNPWSRDDTVYLPSEEHREEYLKNEFGSVYMGTPQNMVSRSWVFGQFEEGILEICLNLLQLSPQHMRNQQKDYLNRWDPVYVSRVVCAMINCKDDRGVLKGNWSGDYSTGMNPSQWTGSADILRRWARSQFKPVCHGQCWVYAAVMCTVMRVLGIPTRVVTNFNSAHDTNANLIIEEFYSEKGEKLQLTQDSIWNFHVWVECWMARPDLGYGFDGWQVLDPTPQERSEGVFCCGPCPVKAIKKKRLDMMYDTPFVFAEVNADIHTIILNNNCEVNRAVDASRIGSLICTKGVGVELPENITSTYKVPKDPMTRYSALNRSGPREEGIAHWGNFVVAVSSDLKSKTLLQNLIQWFNQVSSCMIYFEGGMKSVEITMMIPKLPTIGESISITVTIVNKEKTVKTVKENINAQAKEYNLSPMATFWEEHRRIQMGPYEVKDIQHQILYSQYAKALVGDNLVNLAVVVEDEATQDRGLATEEFNIVSPRITIQVANEYNIVKNVEQSGLIIFTNPLPVPMSGYMMTIEGIGLIEGEIQSELPILQPAKTIEKVFTFTPKASGLKMLQASLVSRDHTNIRGFKTIQVKPV